MYRNSDRCQVICESPLCLFSTASTLHDLKKFQWSWPKKYLVLIYIFSFTHCHLLALSLSHAFLLSLILFLSISLTRISPFSDSLSAYLFFLPLSDSLSRLHSLSLWFSLSLSPFLLFFLLDKNFLTILRSIEIFLSLFHSLKCFNKNCYALSLVIFLAYINWHKFSDFIANTRPVTLAQLAD